MTKPLTLTRQQLSSAPGIKGYGFDTTKAAHELRVLKGVDGTVRLDQGDAFVLLDPQLPIASLRDTLNTIEVAGLMRFADGLKVAERILQEAAVARSPKPLRLETQTYSMRERYLDGAKDREDYGERLFDLATRG